MTKSDDVTPLRAFVSYGREDREIAKRVDRLLVRQGFTTFFDTTDLIPGTDPSPEIAAEIGESQIFVLIVSEHSVSPGRYALQELRIWMELHPSPYERLLPIDVNWAALERTPDRERDYIRSPARVEYADDDDLVLGLGRAAERLAASARRRIERSRAGVDPSTPFNLPPLPARFAGRESELAALHAVLHRSQHVGVTQQTAAFGHGGVGKSALALAYAWRHVDAYPGGLLFLSCKGIDLVPAIAGLASWLGIEPGEKEKETDTAIAVRKRLEQAPRSLLILDDVPDAAFTRSEEWRTYLPSRGECRRLLTTRESNLVGHTMFPVARLSLEDGVAVLGRLRADALEVQNRPSVEQVVEWFGGLAVGLVVSGNYMARRGDALSWDAYVAFLESKGLDAVRVVGEKGGQPADYETRTETVFDDTLDQLSRLEREALNFAALLPEAHVPQPWLQQLLAESFPADGPDPDGELEEPAPYAGAVDSLVRGGLLTPSDEDVRLLSLHAVLRRRVLQTPDERPGEMEQRLDRVVSLVGDRAIASRNSDAQREIRWEATPIAQFISVLGDLDRPLDAAEIANWLSPSIRMLGRPLEASRLLARAIDVQEASLDSMDPILAVSYSNWALVLKDLGDLAGARERLERAIEIGEQHFDSDHPTLAASYSNLATVLQDLGDLAGARERGSVWSVRSRSTSSTSTLITRGSRSRTRTSRWC